MRIGKVVKPDGVNYHLDSEFIEVFPEGNVADLCITTAIPAEHKRASYYETKNGQSPLLVRKRYWDEHYAAKFLPQLAEGSFGLVG
jgi:hypothetical protein